MNICIYHLCENELIGNQIKFCSHSCKTKHNVNIRRRKVKHLLIEHLGGSCENCGYNKCDEALQFHHKDPNEKDFSISRRNLALETLKKEVEKCVLLCANCHAEEHANDRSLV